MDSPIIIYKTYTPAQKRAIDNYRSKNKDKIHTLNKKYYEKIKENPEFLESRRKYAREYYYRKKFNRE